MFQVIIFYLLKIGLNISTTIYKFSFSIGPMSYNSLQYLFLTFNVKLHISVDGLYLKEIQLNITDKNIST